MTAIANPGSRAPHRHVVLAMLLLVYVFNFVDRQILAILAAPIQADLALSDGQMGALGGIAFALLYSTLAVPLAALADRRSRSWVIAVSLVVWSAFTALCGMAASFWQIFVARLGVGVGEAGGVAPSYALIGDYFRSSRRAFALSIYSLGIPLGSAVGVLAGGYLAATIDWRIAFIVVGIGGVLVAPVFKLLVRDPPRPVASDTAALETSGFRETAALLARKPAFWLLSFGAASGSMIGYGIAFWLPSVLQRSFAFDLIAASRFFGALLLLGGVAGILLGGWLSDRLGRTDRAFYAWVPAIAYFACAPLFALGLATDDARLAFALFLLPQALSYVWLGPVLSAVQHLVAPTGRSMASALFLLINNLVGLGGGIYLLGAVSDVLAPTYGEQALRYSMLWSLALYVLAALLMGLAGRHLRSGWVAERADSGE